MIVSLTAYNRPEYLLRVLDSYQKAISLLDEDFHLVVRIDPGDHLDMVLKVLSRVKSDVVTINPRVFGLQKNTYEVLTDAWKVADDLNEDFVIHGESDRVLAPDSMKLALWMREKYRDDPTVLFTSLKGAIDPDPSLWLAVAKHNWFTTGWFGIWKPSWEEFVKPSWNHTDWSSFDWNIARTVLGWDKDSEDQFFMTREPTHCIVQPYLSRSKHLWQGGEHAVHYTSGAGDPRREDVLFAGDVDLPEGEFYERIT